MYYAHSENDAGYKESVIEHLSAVTKLAEEYASVWGAETEARTTGLLHDIGKYSDLFQKVLSHEEIHVDHATPGALAALKKYGKSGMAAALAIQGHHDGLQRGFHRDLEASVKMDEEISPSGKRYSCRNTELLLDRFYEDGGSLPEQITSNYTNEYINKRYISSMLYVRMLFSALVDADFIATEAHFNSASQAPVSRKKGAELNPQRDLERLGEYMAFIKASSKASANIASMRNDLFDTCLKVGQYPKGLFTLTAPTGSGKTLAMLAFALKHAQVNGLKRIIFVLPFLNIIEQTGKIYKDVLEPLPDRGYVLEDHSLMEWPDDNYLRYLSENWDAPIVITTTVKFFETLFSNRPSVCRRLHNMAKSVILFDEAQTMPPDLVIPTLAALSELCGGYGSSVLFSTATQPAFGILDQDVKYYTVSGWTPKEIVPRELDLFNRSQRVEVIWQRDRISWEELADELTRQKQVLSIVNIKKHAQKLYKCLDKTDGTFHLSTTMCPAHRLDVLETVKARLEDRQTCRLISTQCVETGVDLDFPAVFRAIAPLEAIIQASGRCNRNGKNNRGKINVFIPLNDEEIYPTKDYQLATIVLKEMLQKGDIDIYNTDVINDYYSRFFKDARLDDKNQKLKAAIEAQDYQEVSKLYHWIPQRTVNILVPYQPKIDTYRELCRIARKGEINRKWLNAARQLSVGIFINDKKNDSVYDYLEEIKDKKGESTGWYILLNEKAYSSDIGFDTSISDCEQFYTA
ncbi:MAG: CRISPR-associated endonuclease/helicase Cas3 [Clostridiales bacterium]|nr:CRISPR-associated endonuclease/helicase Cas3 [Clostridiales bacterium]